MRQAVRDDGFTLCARSRRLHVKSKLNSYQLPDLSESSTQFNTITATNFKIAKLVEYELDFRLLPRVVAYKYNLGNYQMKTAIGLFVWQVLFTLSINASGAEVDLSTFVPDIPIPYDESVYSECILKNTKANMTPYAEMQITAACKIKATPEKCRGSSNIYDLQKCVDECKSAGLWSRKFGECSTD